MDAKANSNSCLKRPTQAMRQRLPVLNYFATVPNGKLVLWCYLIWWGSTVFHHFDPAPGLWLNSLGISVVIGVALILSVGGLNSATQNKWQTFRLFAMPFCVSSFAALIKDKQFIFIFPPSLAEVLTTASFCLVFVIAVLVLRRAG